MEDLHAEEEVFETLSDETLSAQSFAGNGSKMKNSDADIITDLHAEEGVFETLSDETVSAQSLAGNGARITNSNTENNTTGILSISRSGTGQNTLTNNAILIGSEDNGIMSGTLSYSDRERP